MNRIEVGKLLTIASLVDNRIISNETIDAWQGAVGHLDYDTAVEALTLFRRESDRYVQPANIVANVKRILDDRQAHKPKAVGGEVKTPFPKNLDAWSAAWDDPREFSKQEAIYHQQCVDEGLDPHVDYRGTMIGCASCATA